MQSGQHREVHYSLKGTVFRWKIIYVSLGGGSKDTIVVFIESRGSTEFVYDPSFELHDHLETLFLHPINQYMFILSITL